MISAQHGDTVLIRALKSNLVEVVELLLNSGAVIDVKNNVSAHDVVVVVVVVVAEFFSSEFACLLFLTLHNLNPCYQRGDTALLLAAGQENADVVHLLLNNGANINDKDIVCVDNYPP